MFRGRTPNPRHEPRKAVFYTAIALIATACGDAQSDDPCATDDADGVIGGNVTFDVTVDETGFLPSILAAQNKANVTLTLRNNGTKAHGFVIDCLATPNVNGCPTTSCFPASAATEPVAPGEIAMTAFEVPRPEGIYYFHSNVEGDAPVPCAAGAPGCGQFIVK
jgi:hypothetical protein